MKLVFAGNGLTKILVRAGADRWLRSYFIDKDRLAESYVFQFVPLESVNQPRRMSKVSKRKTK